MMCMPFPPPLFLLSSFLPPPLLFSSLSPDHMFSFSLTLMADRYEKYHPLKKTLESLFPATEGLRLMSVLYFNDDTKEYLNHLSDTHMDIQWSRTEMHYLMSLARADRTHTFVWYLTRRVFLHHLQYVIKRVITLEREKKGWKEVVKELNALSDDVKKNWKGHTASFLDPHPLFFQLQNMSLAEQKREMMEDTDDEDDTIWVFMATNSIVQERRRGEGG
jgi:hypothetical protein